MFHPAMGVGWSYYRPLFDRLRGLGAIVVAHDLRGHDVRGRGSDSGFREIVEVDIPAIVAEARSRWPGHPVWLMGHSLGGQLSAVSAAHNALPVEGLVLIAAGSAHHRGFPSWRGLRNRLLAPCFAAMTIVLGYWPGDRVGFGGRQPRRLLLDWAYLVRTGRYRSGDTGREYDDDLHRWEQPLLLVGVDGDTLAPEGAIHELRKKMPRARATALRRPRPLGGKDPHFSWVRGDDGLARAIVEWML
ncbi:alpha/beta fold hydrolase [Leifsonia sp. EB34]|uniref:alpha/beta hydrolase family protein n=1 Tax=Leifsonia sp. EB34 TaxID=3156303 RepID=UPI0035187800